MKNNFDDVHSEENRQILKDHKGTKSNHTDANYEIEEIRESHIQSP